MIVLDASGVQNADIILVYTYFNGVSTVWYFNGMLACVSYYSGLIAPD